ncbi:F-box domain-containing protein [Thelonectria olida]|uniref:F-box domain-containing protein n=1 Tax=Thelonectria olida TaxID=1576542 RepID=A0A9P9AL82_9HYPO|nr:F-box domain-containing protein [Thelonectria olida]
MDALSPAIDVAADAQPVDDEMAPNSSQVEAPSPPSESNALRVYQDGSNDNNGQSLDAAEVDMLQIQELPNEVLSHILGFLDVSDLLSVSRTNHLFRDLSTAPILHHYRLRHVRSILPPLLFSPSRPSLANLTHRHIFMTQRSVLSRRLARSLVSIKLSHRLSCRPTAATLVERCVLPKECVPGMTGVHIAPGLVSRKKAIEKERVKDGLRQWIACKWSGKVKEREEGVRRWEESRGIGRVWKMRRFWERVSRGEETANTPSQR